MIYNYGRHEVSAYLVGSALEWIERFHVDGLRVDAVASMLYRDYSREEGEWVPNAHGGRENLEAIAFLRRLNAEIAERFPGDGDRRRIHCLAGRDHRGRTRRAGLQPQMEHGLDARHLALPAA